VPAAIALAVLATVVDGTPGVRGALIGVAAALVFLLLTVIVGLATSGRDPLVMAGALMGSWLIKVVVALVALVGVRGLEGVEDLWVGIGVLVGIVLTLAAETRALLTARVPYVDTTSRPVEGDAPVSSQ
jgi:hypothetical protein